MATPSAPVTTEPRHVPAPVPARAALGRDLFLSSAVAIGLWATVTPDPGRVAQGLLAVTAVAAVLTRRHSPRACLAAAAVATALGWGAGVTADPCVLVGACLFTVAEQRGRAVLPWWAWGAAAGVGLLLLLTSAAGMGPSLRWVVLSAVVLTTSWVLGVRSRQLREQVGLRAAADERLRIAREVHDTLSHCLGSIGVRAGIAAHVHTKDGDRLRAALDEVAEQARAALSELHAVVHTLRRDTPTDSVAAGPAPSGSTGEQWEVPVLARSGTDQSPPGQNPPGRGPAGGTAAGADHDLPGRLAHLVDTLTRCGITARLSIGPSTHHLPDAVRQELVRVAQEATANVIRHARATCCHIDLSLGPVTGEQHAGTTKLQPSRTRPHKTWAHTPDAGPRWQVVLQVSDDGCAARAEEDPGPGHSSAPAPAGGPDATRGRSQGRERVARQGLPADRSRGARVLREGHGLRGVRERAALLGGQVQLGPGLGGAGLSVTVQVPVPSPHRAPSPAGPWAKVRTAPRSARASVDGPEDGNQPGEARGARQGAGEAGTRDGAPR